MKQTQKEWVISQLEQYGEISRNNALQNFITRLSAITLTLKNEGWDLEGKWRGGDYVYSVVKKPVKPLMKKIELINGVPTFVWK